MVLWLSSIEPNDVRGHLNLGNIFLKINNTKEAEVSYRRATNLFEELTKTSSQISSLHLTALLRLSELISRDPKKTKEAFLLHERILTLKSDFSPAFESLTKVMRASNQRIEATVMLAKALEYESSDPDILYNVSHLSIKSPKSNPLTLTFDKRDEHFLHLFSFDDTLVHKIIFPKTTLSYRWEAERNSIVDWIVEFGYYDSYEEFRKKFFPDLEWIWFPLNMISISNGIEISWNQSIINSKTDLLTYSWV